VESNIRRGREDISDERVRWAANEVRADNFIGGLPQEYKSEVRERGAGLSVGQKTTDFIRPGAGHSIRPC